MSGLEMHGPSTHIHPTFTLLGFQVLFMVETVVSESSSVEALRLHCRLTGVALRRDLRGQYTGLKKVSLKPKGTTRPLAGSPVFQLVRSFRFVWLALTTSPSWVRGGRWRGVLGEAGSGLRMRRAKLVSRLLAELGRCCHGLGG